MQGLIAKKVGMSRVFLENGDAVPVTYLKVEPNTVVRLKVRAKDGYDAVVLGVDERHWKSRKGKEQVRFRTQKEWQVEKLDGFAQGVVVTAKLLPKDTVVTVVGVSKGKGFQGGMKRHHFAGGPGSHGSHFTREPGSVGMREMPGRIHKGKRMAGRMGGDRVTVANRPVLVCDAEGGVVAVKGPVPGQNGATVYLTVEQWPDGFDPATVFTAEKAQETAAPVAETPQNTEQQSASTDQ